MRARTDLWERQDGNAPGPPGPMQVSQDARVPRNNRVSTDLRNRMRSRDRDATRIVFVGDAIRTCRDLGLLADKPRSSIAKTSVCSHLPRCGVRFETIENGWRTPKIHMGVRRRGGAMVDWTGKRAWIGFRHTVLGKCRIKNLRSRLGRYTVFRHGWMR